jgi:hypothetical protein
MRRTILTIFASFAALGGAGSFALSAAGGGAPQALPAANDAPAAVAGAWRATGTLLESCTCAVPCTCNFGEGPSPHHYCHAVFGYRLDKGSWDGVDLSGLVVAGADGPGGAAGYLDARATPTQRPALERLGRAVFAQGGPSSGPRSFVPAAITHEVKGNRLRLDIAGRGGFTADVIIGRDGKSPVVVENNTVWPIPRATKAKARPLAYRDAGAAGVIRGDGTNANYGAFSFAGKTANAAASGTTVALRSKAATPSKPGCCALKR